MLKKNLEKFLTWREQNQINGLQWQDLKISKTDIENNRDRRRFDDMSVSLEKSFFRSKKSQRTFYKPISEKPSLKNLKEKVFTKHFFPHKKAFMKLWIFPLLGGCFLSQATFNGAKNSLQPFRNFPGFGCWTQTANLEADVFDFKNLNLGNRQRSIHSSFPFLDLENQDPTHFPKNRSVFSAAYRGSQNTFYPFTQGSSESLATELENLCLVYLNLMDRDFQTSVENVQAQSSFAFSQEKFFFDHFSSRNQSFDWVWHSLTFPPHYLCFLSGQNVRKNKVSDLTFSNVFENRAFVTSRAYAFPQKMKNIDFFQKKIGVEFEKKASDANPILSYFDSSVLLDHWRRDIELDSLDSNSKNASSIDEKTKTNLLTFSTPFCSDSLEKIYALENSFSTDLKNQKSIAFAFSALLEGLNSKALDLKKIDFIFRHRSNTLLKTGENKHFLKTSPHIKKSDPESFVKTIQSEYQRHAIKLWLKTFFFEKRRFSNQLEMNLFDLKRESFRTQTFAMVNAQTSFRAKLKFKSSLEKTLFLKVPNLETCAKKKLSYVLKKLVSLQADPSDFCKQTVFEALKVNPKKALKNQGLFSRQILDLDTNLFNIDETTNRSDCLKNSEKKFQEIAHDLVLLKYWQKIFKKAFLRYEQTPLRVEPFQKSSKNRSFKKNFSKWKKGEVLKDEFSKAFEKKEAVLTKKSNPVITRFIEEINLYRQFSTLLTKYVYLDGNVPFRKGSVFRNSILKTPVLRYQTPILLAGFKEDSSNAGGFTSQQNFLDPVFFTKDEYFQLNVWNRKTSNPYRKSAPAFEISTKESSISSSIVSSTKLGLTKVNFKPIPLTSFFSRIPFVRDVLDYGLRPFVTSRLFEKLRFSNGNHFLLFSEPGKVHRNEIKTFRILKNRQPQFSENLFVGSSLKANDALAKKTRFKKLQPKMLIEPRKILLNSEKRKAEKIFRVYLSIKTLENQSGKLRLKTKPFLQNLWHNEKTNFDNLVPILKKLRKINKVILRDPKKKKHLFALVKQSGFKGEFLRKQSFYSNFNKNGLRLFLNEKSKFNEHVFQNPQRLKHSQIFPVKSFVKNLASFHFLKPSHFSTNDLEFKRLQKKKTLQKKRRLKKLKLENRRRKKRKRFYPRPDYLRSHLYALFLNKRHPTVFSKDSETSMQSLIYESAPVVGKSEARRFFQAQNSHRARVKSSSFHEKIYRQKKQRWGNVGDPFRSEKSSLKSVFLNSTNPVYHDQELYKISNETLAEFERLCWKSYWLRSNLTPYIRRIQKNLQKMRKMESFKHTRTMTSEILKAFHPRFSKIGMFDGRIGFPHRHTQLKSLAPAYLNIQESVENSFFKTLSFPFFKKLENKAEYNRLIYQRITDEIKNVKNQLNLDGQNHARSYKAGRQKLETSPSRKLFDSLNSLKTQFLEPKTEAFSIFSTPNDVSLKPFGDLPTLRILWACNKTNLFPYKETNFAKSLWSIYKNKEQTKTNKTKKFISKNLRFDGFGKKNIQTLSREKMTVFSKKIQSLTGFIYGKNVPTYLRKMKFELKRRSKVECFIKTASFLGKPHLPGKRGTANEQMSKVSQSQSLNHIKNNWFDSSFDQKPQKRMVHFWWSTRQANPIERIFALWMSSPWVFPTFDRYVSEHRNPLTASNPFDRDFEREDFSGMEKNLSNRKWTDVFLSSTFWICCLFFHVSILFALIRIPEIRSLAKFQFLILEKFIHIYLFSLFSIYDSFKSYKVKLGELFKKTVFSSTENHFERRFVENAEKTQKTIELGEFNLRSFNEINLQKQKARAFLFFKRSSFNDKTSIRFTIMRVLNFRRFVHFSEKNRTFSGLKEFSRFNAKVLNLSTFYSISPALNKPAPFRNPTLPFLVDSSLAKQANPKNWFYSWYTGFLWYTFENSFEKESFKAKKEFYFREPFKNTQKNAKKQPNPRVSKRNFNFTKKQVSTFGASAFQVQSVLSLLILSVSKISVKAFYMFLTFFYASIYKVIDILETILLVFYKFLEKPAELMVEWIADIFLIEWSSDLITYLPEAFDTHLNQSLTKLSRGLRPLSVFPFGFLAQRIFLESSETFYSWLLKPDTDLIIRQKKGIIFWDIWTEVLLQAAEKYKMNLSSLSTIKEEQDLLIENLFEEKTILAGSGLGFAQPQESFAFRTLKNRKKGDDEKPAFTRNSKNNGSKIDMFAGSLSKLTPLLQFLQIQLYGNFSKHSLGVSNFKDFDEKTHPSSLLLSECFLSRNAVFKPESIDFEKVFDLKSRFNANKRWAANQYFTIQGRDTDLFMDIHPPKSFLHISFLKTHLPAQEILGSLACDIYSNRFAQNVSKNVLIVGAPGAAKSSFIQALAGETELKIVTDNAHRYSFVQGGVPIGMKLLRDVFDSISLHTPCLFLLEDIHIIGERRPMLISDDETSKANDFTFGAEQEEVHEKNRFVYQSSRHSLTHYKRPYKGDFSLSIPTNHFSYDLFLGINGSRKRRSDMTPKSPLPVFQLEKALKARETSIKDNESPGSMDPAQNRFLTKTFLSVLQISSDQFFAPPATSPFSILLMKEQKKFKPKKIVKEMPWSGFSQDQLMLVSKTNYSVRVKVALLAELAMTNLSVKLDMITDLLVIVDSVRSNRGFVVFATTHVPSLLDPALRRPGRLDETISLPLLPNLTSRLEIFKTRLSACTEVLDFFDFSLLTWRQKQNENQMDRSITKSLLLLLNTKNFEKFNIEANLFKPQIFEGFFNDYPIYSVSQAFQITFDLNACFLAGDKTFRSKLCVNRKQDPFQRSLQKASVFDHPKATTLSVIGKEVQPAPQTNNNLNDFLKKNPDKLSLSGKDAFHLISLSYAQAGQFLIEALIVQDQSTYSEKWIHQFPPSYEKFNTEETLFKTLYSSKTDAHHIFMQSFAAKISPFFVLNTSSNVLKSGHFTSSKLVGQARKTRETIASKKEWWFTNPAALQTNPSQSNLMENVQNGQTSWKFGTTLLDAFFQKRYLYQKNAVVSKLLLFEDGSSLRESPSPPSSSILMPAKKFENYKRTFRDFVQKPMFTIHEKMQMHQKQRFLKVLYNVDVQPSFKAASSQNKLVTRCLSTNFQDSFKELGYLDLRTLKPTSSGNVYQNRFLVRHRFSLLNQWWNGQLAEHNVETTYLSHVDWRSMFVQSLGDLVIDFPDAEQYYNPRSRRWFLHSSSWHYWFDLEKNFKDEIFQHYIMQSFTKAFALFNGDRELFDYLAFRFLRDQRLKEIDFLQSLIRFYKTKG